MSLTSVKFADLRAIGSGYRDDYVDEYEETDRISIVPSKFSHPLAYVETEGWVRVSSVFQYVGELSEHPDIWTAITTVWNNRGTYGSTEELRAAIDAALVTGGYTVL